MAQLLVVDDDLDVAHSLAAFLEDRDHEVQVCTDAEAAIQWAEECRPELAVVDLRLPLMNGEALIRHLREALNVRHFLIYTGAVHYHLAPELQALGMNSGQVFYKPLESLEVLASRVDSLLGGAS